MIPMKGIMTPRVRIMSARDQGPQTEGSGSPDSGPCLQRRESGSHGRES